MSSRRKRMSTDTATEYKPEVVALVKKIVEMESLVKQAKKEIDKNREILAENLGVKIGPLTEKQHEKYKGKKFEIPQIANVTVYASNGMSTDWEYLEKVLSSEQLTRAKKINYFAAMKFFKV
jgi:hypothetical protein